MRIQIIAALVASTMLAAVAANAQGQRGGQGGAKVDTIPMPKADALLKHAKPQGPQGKSWAEIAQLPDLATGAWQNAPGPNLDPPNPSLPRDVNNPNGGHYDMLMPWTAKWQKRFDAVKKTADSGGDVPSRAYHCTPLGYGGILGGGPGGLLEFQMKPGEVTVLGESVTIMRIYTDGRKHQEDPDLTFFGDNVGYWDNGTLVIDTVGLDAGNEFIYGMPGGEGMHAVNRIHLIGPDLLQQESVLEAPEALTKPYVRVSRLGRNTKWAIMDDYCTQNNRDVGDNGEQIFDLTPPEKD